ncbi:MAG: prepilin peptidase [Proteobacteria bacterium]|nr:prepilin peptidase [Pseudomonadota bacterium]
MEYFYLFIVGLLFGSFLNVAIFRYPAMLKRKWRSECTDFLDLPVEPTTTYNLALPHSHCRQCNQPLKFWHNIPIISYLSLRGKCYFCRHAISLQYPLIELLTALITVLIVWKWGWAWQSAAIWLMCCGLITLACIDWRDQILPDTLTLSLLWLGLMVNRYSMITSLNEAVLGAITGYSILWIVAHVFMLIRKKPGMGHGDFKMLAMLGAWLGVIPLFYVLLAAILLSLFFNLSLLLFKKINFAQTLPFGPWLAISGGVMLIFHPTIADWIAKCFALV